MKARVMKMIDPWDWQTEDKFVGKPENHDTYTITLGELHRSGVFDWNSDILNWREAAIDDEQYNRFCAYFIERFEFREISIIPFYEWARRLRFRLIYELMPKYKPLYENISGINPFAERDEYGKERSITSAYPETMLSGNSDYASDGRDIEYEKITLGNVAEREKQYIADFRSVDAAICDELENMFACMYTVAVNGF